MKACTRCKKNKELSEFYKDSRAKSGLYSSCKKCHYLAYKASSYPYKREWARRNPDKVKRSARKHVWVNSEKNRTYRRLYMRRWSLNPKNRITGNVRNAVGRSLKGQKNWRKWGSLTGYGIDELLKHLESQFDEKMSFDNYGSYWEIDHIKPVCSFNFKTAEDPEFKKCWALENLQPLEASANRIKNKKIINT